MDVEGERRARNEALFREVNERVEELADRLSGYGNDPSLLAGFVCECSRSDCASQLQVSYAKYETVRENPLRFLVLPGHEDLEVDRVLERHGGFFVVEKFGEASEIAVEEDPRS
jgi:hypothetical protein